MTIWSPQQNQALSMIAAWLRMRYSQSFYLAGWAGAGKTKLAQHIAEMVDGPIAFAAFTGKAARVMRSKGCHGASTIHSLIYDVQRDLETDKFQLFLKPRQQLAGFKLIIIDEVSMVNERIGRDLLSFGIPVLVLGDPAQLPPPNGAGYFTSKTPDFMLTETHRQAQDSYILRLATDIRCGRWSRESIETADLSVVRKRDFDNQVVMGADVVLVGRNNTRQSFNGWIRKSKGISQPSMPKVGEPVICLSNDREKMINNGDLFKVERIIPNKGRSRDIRLELRDDDSEVLRQVKVPRKFFEDDVAAAKLPYNELIGRQQFTFGYAITCHKSQGSQWPHVCVFDESSTFREEADRWLYTAVTRASDKLTLVLKD